MSLQEVSIGNDLKDSFKPTSKWVNNGINWINDIEEFYRERATIEKEYASKLLELCKSILRKGKEFDPVVCWGRTPDHARILRKCVIGTLERGVNSDRSNCRGEGSVQ